MLYLRLRQLPILVLFFILLTPPVSAQAIDVAWTFGNVGSSSYRLDAYDPPDISFGDLGAADPTLPLQVVGAVSGPSDPLSSPSI